MAGKYYRSDLLKPKCAECSEPIHPGQNRIGIIETIFDGEKYPKSKRTLEQYHIDCWKKTRNKPRRICNPLICEPLLK